MSHRIAISSGDYNGIGPEVILKCLNKRKSQNDTVIILSSQRVIDFYSELLDIPLPRQNVRTIDEIQPGKVNVLECYDDINIEPGKLSQKAGKCAMQAVEKGIELCNTGLADALVTAPISKEAVNLAGYHIPGHTEFLAEHTHTDDFMMMLVNDNLRVGLASVHIPIADVPQNITEDSITRYLRIMNSSLQRDFNIARPRIAVFGLNPHAGDGGIIGKEEQDIISPAIQKAQELSINVSGPYAADGFFGNKKYEECDGILAMYHDQGLVPFKALSFGAGVNFTAGLPIVRTSPDHGTAFDIAGKGKANPSSFEQAFSLARQLSANRKQKAQ
ncbi:4-hydroxythreonine-4-phosphate dehydrogenase PdxA [Aliifodinibius salicampi]|uniref:4-hydroxythreonine-4-phosphate dehydrogenase PdxA n=1 Tax=Fodinibius salicampi TaxID=1920655 RepID=A0ABT3PVD9_9BACT|nr:4-hydroxythreonine-4-phosphate dehydrogenase PdxA [Fodinibius salicampi]MCW9711814.1 4-hydroxythreonine-4-phosphate dehydrogenase PdxA [Fodinibius salicampi]